MPVGRRAGTSDEPASAAARAAAGELRSDRWRRGSARRRARDQLAARTPRLERHLRAQRAGTGRDDRHLHGCTLHDGAGQHEMGRPGGPARVADAGRGFEYTATGRDARHVAQEPSMTDTPLGFVALKSIKQGPEDPKAALAQIRQIYFKTTKRTIEHDMAHAIRSEE